MKLIMIDHADKGWVRNYKEPTEAQIDLERKAQSAITVIVAAFIGVIMLICALVLAFNSWEFPAVDDYALSPDMQSYIESSKAPVVLREEDIE